RSVGPDRYRFSWTDNGGAVTATSERPFSDGQKAFLAIRPEKVQIATEKPESENALRGRVHDIAYLGNISTYHVEIEGGRMVKAQTANTRRLSARTITWEDEVWLSWTPTAAVLLES
ncbi:MAG: TOBE domain-containing protein, partial [Rhodobacteraceae bacterium]